MAMRTVPFPRTPAEALDRHDLVILMHHGKAQADQWQRYIREKMSRALSGGSGWFLFGLAFVVVYREVFETILFYAALSAQGDNGMLLAGAGSARWRWRARRRPAPRCRAGSRGSLPSCPRARRFHCQRDGFVPHPSVVPDSDANTVDTNGKQHSHNLASRRKPHYPNWV